MAAKRNSAKGRMSPSKNRANSISIIKVNKQYLKLWCGAVLVVIGLFFLLINFGIPAQAIGKLWPLVVVGFGFAILLQR